MTRREALIALALMYALIAAGATLLLGGYGLIGTGILGILAVLLLFERVEARGEVVPDAVPREWREAFERDQPL